MDEILIDEKKYISSKQAAKITGYAKDYIGQLCREGRVPARLVGRSWYVLESAIQDHRFSGEMDTNQPARSAAPWAAESPRYEGAPATPEPILPRINRIKNKEIEIPKEDIEPQEAPESLQESWKAWFDKVGDAIASVAAPEPEKGQPEVPSPEPEPEVVQEEILYQELEEEVSVPIHTIYKAPPRDILPRYRSELDPAEETLEEETKTPVIRRRGRRSFGARTLQVVVILIAVVTASVAVIGSGYLDSFIVSIQQANSISGISIYNK